MKKTARKIEYRIENLVLCIKAKFTTLPFSLNAVIRNFVGAGLVPTLFGDRVPTSGTPTKQNEYLTGKIKKIVLAVLIVVVSSTVIIPRHNEGVIIYFSERLKYLIAHSEILHSTQNVDTTLYSHHKRIKKDGKVYSFEFETDNYKAGEVPQFNISQSYDVSPTGVPKLVKTAFASVFKDENKKLIAQVINYSGEVVEKSEVDGIGGILALPDLKPGKYTLQLKSQSSNIKSADGQRENGQQTTDNGTQLLLEQDFTWGVLAINTNKSTYTPGETAKIDMAVLDETGNMVCDAKVELRIKHPESGIETILSTEDYTIKINEDCSIKDYTLNPDYETSLKTDEVGTYEYTLTAETGSGTWQIKDGFKVNTSNSFDVERFSATRIYPLKNYPMVISITPDQDFAGTVEEKIPTEFLPTYIPPKEMKKIWALDHEINNGVEYIHSPIDTCEERHSGTEQLGVIEPQSKDPTAKFTLSEAELLQDAVKNGKRKKPTRRSFSEGGENSNNCSNLLRWDVNWKAGETYYIAYQMDIPDKSPDFYLLAPLEIYTNAHETENETTQIVGADMSIRPFEEVTTHRSSPTNRREPISRHSAVWTEPSQWQIAVDAISFVQTADNENGSDSVSASFSSGATSGNLIVAVCAARGSFAITGPSGFTSAINETGNVSQGIFYDIAAGGETTISCSATGTDRIGIHIYEYSDIDDTNTLNDTASNSGTGTSVSTGTLTTTVADTVLVAGLAAHANTSYSSWTNSFTERNDFTNGGGPNLRVTYGGADRIVASTGSYSTTATTDSSGDWIGQIAAFNQTITAITVSGTTDVADGTTVALAIDGSLQGQTTTTSGGTWSITGVTPPSSGSNIVVFTDVDDATSANRSSAVMTYSGNGNVTGMVLNQHALSIGASEDSTTSVADLITDYDYDDDNDILYTANSSTLALDPGSDLTDEEIVVLSGDVLTVAGTETLTSHDVEINGTLTATGNATINVSGSWDNNSVFNNGTSTVTMTTSGSSETISNIGATTHAFNNLTITGDDTVQLNSTTTVDGDVTVSSVAQLELNSQNLDINGGNLTTVSSGGVSCNSCTSGTVTLSGDGTTDGIGGGSASITFYNLSLDGSSNTTNVSTNFSVLNELTVGSGRTLDMSTNDLNVGSTSVSDSGDISVSGTLTQSGGTTNTITPGAGQAFIGGSGSITFYNLSFTPSVSNAILYLGNNTNQTINISNDFTIGDGTNSITVNANQNDPIVDIGNNLTISTNATLSASSDSNLEIGNNFSNSGIFTHNNGTVTMNAGDAGNTLTGQMTGSDSFYNLIFDNASGSWTIGDQLETDNDFTLTSATDVTISDDLTVRGNFSGGSTFTANNATTVSFAGSSGTTQLVSGSTTFYNLTATSSSSRTIEFEAGSTQFISNSLTLTGSGCSNLLMLRSSTSGTQYTIDGDYLGTLTLQSLDIQDSVDPGGTLSATNSSDSGNNSGWTIDENCTGASSSSNATAKSFQRKTFYDSTNSRHWMFFYDGNEIEYKYSSDSGSTWTRAGSLSYSTNDFSVWQETISTTEYIFVALSDSNSIKLFRGTLSTTDISWDGGGTPTAVTALTGTGASDDYSNPFISLGTSDYIWIGAKHTDGSDHNYIAIRSDDTETGDISTWSDLSFGTTIEETLLMDPQSASSNVYGNIVPIANQDMYATIAVGTSLQGCIWDSSDSNWENKDGENCYPTQNAGDIEGTGKATRSTAGAVKIDDASNFGAITGTGRQIIQNSNGQLYTFINNNGSCEIWKSDDGSTWTEQDSANNPSCDSGNTVSLALDSTNVLHMGYTSGADHKYITFSTITDTFGTSETIKTAALDAQGIDIAIDSNDKPHVIIEFTDTASSESAEYTNRISGSWKTPVVLKTLTSSTCLDSPSIVINKDDVPIVSYFDNCAVVYLARGNQNDAGSFEETAHSTASTNNPVSLGVDSNGNIWVSYIEILAGPINDVRLAKHNYGDAWDISNWQTGISNSNEGSDNSLSIIGSSIFVFYQDHSTDQQINYDVYDSGTEAWKGSTTFDIPGSGVDFNNVKVRYSKYNFYDDRYLDVIFSDGTDVYWNVLDTRPVKVDDDSDFGTFLGAGRQVVRASDGTYYAILEDSEDIEVWKSSDGYTWEEQDSANGPTPSGSTLNLNGAAIDSSDTIHILYTDITVSIPSNTHDLKYESFSSDLFSGTPETIVDNSDQGDLIDSASLTVDSANTVHVVYSLTDDAGTDTAVWYKNGPGVWSTRVSVSSAASNYVDISINEESGGGKPEIVYIDSSNQLVAEIGDGNDPNSFTSHTIDTTINTTSGQQIFSIAVDTLTGDTWIGYVDSDNTIALAKHTGSTWTSNWSTITTKTETGYEPSIAIAENSQIYVFYQAQDSGITDDIAYDLYDSISGEWNGEAVLNTGTYQDVKVKWAFENNNFGANRIDYLFSDGTDVFWDFLYIRREPTNIDDASDFGSLFDGNRQLVRTSDGVLYAAIYDSPNIEIWKSTDGGNSWSEQDSADKPTASNDFSIAIGSNDIIHIAYEDESSPPDVDYITFDTTTDQFGTGESIATGPQTDVSYVSIALDSNNLPHVAFYEDSTTDFVRYYNKVGGSWGLTNVVQESFISHINIAINRDDEPILAYQTIDPGVTTAKGDANDPSSFTLFDVDTSITNSTGISLGIDSDGNTWVVYVDDDGSSDFITLAKHTYGTAFDNGTNWTTDITNSNEGRDSSMVVDGTDIYVFYEDDQDDIVFDKYDGSSWDGETLLEQHGNLQDAKVKWSYLNNYGSDGTDYGSGGSNIPEFDYLYSDGTDVYYNRFKEGFIPGNQDSIDTVDSTKTSVLSAVVDPTNNDVHLVFADDETTDQLSYKRWDSATFTWDSSPVKISDTVTEIDYVSLSLDTNTDGLVAFFIDTVTNDINYSSCAASNDATNCSTDGNWTKETLWKTGTFTHITTNYEGSCETFALHTEETAQSAIHWDYVEGGAGGGDPILSQEYFEWFVNETSVTLTDAWPSGSLNISENTVLNSIPATYLPLDTGDQVRLQMNFQVTDSASCPANLENSTKQFQLQYAEGDVCSTIPNGNWNPVGDKGATNQSFRLFDNATVDGSSDDSIEQVNQISNSTSTAEGYYSEINPTAVNPNDVNINEYSEWDWPIENYSASENTSYCFRMVEHDGVSTTTVFDNYSFYPRLITKPGTSNLLRGGNFFQGGNERGFFWAD